MFTLSVPAPACVGIGGRQKTRLPTVECQPVRVTAHPGRVMGSVAAPPESSKTGRFRTNSRSQRILVDQGELELRFTNGFGEELVGWLRDAGDPDRLAVLCHGYMSNATSCHFVELSRALALEGVSCFRFDHPMAIDSPSECGRPFVTGNYAEEGDEIQAAIDFLASSGYRTSHLIGHSKGGFNVFLFGATRPIVPPTVITISGRFDMRVGVLQRFGEDILDKLQAAGGALLQRGPGFEWTLTSEDLMARLSLDVRTLAEQWPASSQLAMIHGTGDTTISWHETEWLAELVPGARTDFIDGADHNFSRQEPELVRAVLDAVLPATAAGAAAHGG